MHFFGLVVKDVDAVCAKWQVASVELLGEPHDMLFGYTAFAHRLDKHLLCIYLPVS